MKKLLLLLFLSTISIHASQAQDFSIVGTWKLVGTQGIRNGITYFQATNSENVDQLKTWTKENFLFVGKTISNYNKNYSFGSGNYTLQGNNYTEMIKVHATTSHEGKMMKLYMELKGDTLFQIGPVKADWSIDKENCWMEKYIKVE